MLSPTRGVRDALTAWLRAHLPDDLLFVGAGEGVALTPPRTWARVADYATVPEEQLPACYITTGSAAVAWSDQEGHVGVDVTCRVVMVAAGRDRVETEDRAALMVDAARFCLQRDVTLGGVLERLEVTAWAPAGTALDGVANGTYRAAHDLAVTATALTTRRPQPTGDPAITTITTQLDRLEP